MRRDALSNIDDLVVFMKVFVNHPAAVDVSLLPNMTKEVFKRKFGRNLRHDVLTIHKAEYEFGILEHRPHKTIVAGTRRTERVQGAFSAAESHYGDGGESGAETVPGEVDRRSGMLRKKIRKHGLDFGFPDLFESQSESAV